MSDSNAMLAKRTAPTASPSEEQLRAAARALGSAGGGLGAARLITLLYDPQVRLDRVVAALHGDPALAARVLKVANSPYYRLPGHVGTIERAVQLLGLAAIRGIAAAGCLDRLNHPRHGEAFDPDAFRNHGLAVACAAQMLSSAGGCGVDSEAFIGGLLHDIGLLLMVKLDPARMGSYEPPTRGTAAHRGAVERAHFGTTHEACGSLLVDTWGLPKWLSEAIGQHHEEPIAPVPQGLTALPTLLALAQEAASLAGYGLWANTHLARGREMAASVRLDLPAVQAVSEQLPAAMARISASQ